MRISSAAELQTSLLLVATFLSFAQALQIATGQAVFADWDQQQPGARHRITVADLPEPPRKLSTTHLT
jgi:hypothetical protein